MSETRVRYEVSKPDANRAILDTDLYTLRDQLFHLKRQLVSLLVTVERALGEEPSVMTRSERRRG